MTNELLWFIFALVNFILIAIAYKLFGKTGLFAWIAFSSILANIQVVKFITLFGLTATLGNIMYGTIFLATDTLSEKYGLKEAKRSVYIGFFTLISMVIIMQIALLFIETGDGVVQSALETIFVLMPRIALGSLTAYIISQLLDVHLFQKIKEHFNSDNLLFVRNIGSTMTSQLVDTLIFVPIAFLGAVPSEVLVDIILTTYVIKLLVALLDTPFIYLMKKIKPLTDGM
ncbi:MAG: queuosine precursor transporter [Bacillota bacterium]